MNPILKKFLPHLGAWLLLFVISAIFFKPYVFEGKVLQQGDNMQAKGMQAEVREIIKETGEYPLWTNSAFAGMPTYQISYKTNNMMKHPFKAILLGNDMRPPHTAILLMMFGVYLLLITIGIDWRIGLLGAVGFGFSSYFVDLVAAGHSTKIIALGYMAPILAGVLMVFRGRYLMGGLLTAFFLALQVYANHLQITYYFMMTLGMLGIFYLVDAIKNKTLPVFAKAVGVLVLAATLALSTQTSRLWTTYEYSKETIRGQSELKNKQISSGSQAGEDGLSKEYIFDWSYGKLETFNLLIPNYVGGSSTNPLYGDSGSATLKALQGMGENGQQYLRQSAAYWGPQPFTGGPAYMGAVLILLFFLGAFLVPGRLKWWCIASVILTIMLAWGEHFALFNYFMYDYFPLFNKFRAVTMVLGVTSLFIVLLGMLGLQQLFNKKISDEEKHAALIKAGGTTGGILLLGLLLSFGLDYGTDVGNIPAELASALQEDRAALLRADVLRSLIFIALAFGAMWFYLKKSLKPLLLVAGLGLLIAMDLFGIAGRFISSENWLNPSQKAQIEAPKPADQQILQDKDPHYRVADFSSNIWKSAIPSYHHKSMGGYHAAKLMRYQEMVERYLGDPGTNAHLYGMLNAKYFITQNGQPTPNREALGNAWFVSSYDIVEDGDAEFEGLRTLKPAEKALVQKKYASYLEGLNLSYDSSAVIRLTSYHPDEMVYQSTAKSEQLAVFSEVYYPPSKGWHLYLDGERMKDDFIKANFILRAARIPAGNHELTMKFEPNSYYTGEKVSLIGSLIVIFGLIAGLILYFKNNTLPDPNNLPEPTPSTPTKTRPAKKTTSSRKKKK